jgi:hypothetical protein
MSGSDILIICDLLEVLSDDTSSECCSAVGYTIYYSFIVCGEIIMFPISLPLSKWRKYKYNKWIKEWYNGLSKSDQKILDTIFKGKTTYKSMNKVIYNGNFYNIKKEDYDIKVMTKIVPKYVYRRNRYFWNMMPVKEIFIHRLDFMMKLFKDKWNDQYNNIVIKWTEFDNNLKSTYKKEEIKHYGYSAEWSLSG